MSLSIKKYNEAKKIRVLEGIEKLGGSAGFKKHLELAKHDLAPQKANVQFPNCVAADVEFVSTVVHTWAYITTEGHSTEADSWGAGPVLAQGETSGTLSYKGWATLRSAPNDFVIVAGAGDRADGFTVQFSIGGVLVATFVSNGTVAGAVGCRGTCVWNSEAYTIFT